MSCTQALLFSSPVHLPVAPSLLLQPAPLLTLNLPGNLCSVKAKEAPLGMQHVMEMCHSADVIDIKAQKVTVVGLIREHDKALTSPSLSFQTDKS